MIYLIVLFILFIPVILFDVAGIKKGINGWYFLEFIILVLLAGLRYRVGGDTLFYMSFFDSYPKLNELTDFDFVLAEFNPLWYVFNAFTKFIHDDFTTFQIFHAIVVNSIFFWFFRKYSNYFFTAIFIYFFGYYCYFNMEILREILAISFLMLSIPFLNKRNYFMYYLLSVVALFFHYSAVFMFFIPLFQYLFNNISWKQLSIFSVVIGIILSTVNIIPAILNLFSFNELVAFKLETYLEPKVNLNNILFFYGSILPIIILLYVNDKRDILFNIEKIKGLVVIYAILMVFSAFYHTVFSRLANYIVPFYIIFLIDSFYLIVKEYKLSLHTFYIKTALFIVLFFQSYYYLRDQSEYYPGARFYMIFYPYYSVFNPTIDQERESFLGNLRDTGEF